MSDKAMREVSLLGASVTVRGVVVLVDCPVCERTGSIKDPRHAQYGGRLTCPECKGNGVVKEHMPLDEFKKLVGQ